MVESDAAGGVVTGGRADRGAVKVALQVLEQMHLVPADLVEFVAARAMPTFAELMPKAIEAMPAGSARTYVTYLNKLVATWGPRRLDEFDAGEARRFLARVRETAQVRQSSIGGNAAERHAHRALSWLYRYAVDHEFITERQNVMRLVSRPVTGQARRHALSPQLISDILGVARSTGFGPALDALILRFHLETAARTGGALALRVRDLDLDQSLVRLWEKGATQRWQPVSPTLMEHLLHHARERGVRGEDGRVLRNADGAPLTRSRYDALWERVGRYVESVRVLGVSTHWLRHTTLTFVERNFGYAVARAYAGHAEPKFSPHGVTQVYVKASISEVATALQALTGERHPLALTPASTATRGGSAPVTEPGRAGSGEVGRPTLPGWLGTGDVMDTVVEERLIDRIRGLYEEAEQAGQPRPGRDALVEATGAKAHRVRAAQAEINGTRSRQPVDDLVAQIRRLYEEAERAGRPRPGRGPLVRATGATAYRVRAAQAEINGPGLSTPGLRATAEGTEASLAVMAVRNGRGRWRQRGGG